MSERIFYFYITNDMYNKRKLDYEEFTNKANEDGKSSNREPADLSISRRRRGRYCYNLIQKEKKMYQTMADDISK